MLSSIAAVILHFYLSVMPEVLPCSLGLLLSLRQRSGYPLASSPIVGLLALLRIEEFGFQLSVNVLFFLLPASDPVLKGCTNEMMTLGFSTNVQVVPIYN